MVRGTWRVVVQTPREKEAMARPTKAFLTRYGRRARIRAGDWRERLS
jgi:hypothetical protein